MQVPAPRLWSPEHPELHKIKIDINGTVFESEFGLPVEDVYNNGATKLLDAILKYLEE